MTEPDAAAAVPDASPAPSLAEVAQEPAEESTAKERQIVDDDADTGDVVDKDNAQ